MVKTKNLPEVITENLAEKIAKDVIGDKGSADLTEKFSRAIYSENYPYIFEAKERRLLGLPQDYKSAKDSAEWIKAKYAFEEMIEPGLSHKSAKESAAAIEVLKANEQIEKAKQLAERKNDLRAKYGDELPQFRLKKQQAALKAQLKAKHADKLVK